MYKIYRAKLYEKSTSIFYVLCEGCIEIGWFCVSEGEGWANNISAIFIMKKSINVRTEFPDHLKECVYESPSLQEATNYLEQLRILISV